jgi:glycosyltransferase involved in cell wall biosynthesis
MKIGYFKLNKFTNISHKILSNDLVKYFGQYFDLEGIEAESRFNLEDFFRQTDRKKMDFVFLNDDFDPFYLYRYRTLKRKNLGFLFFPCTFFTWLDRYKSLNSYYTEKDVMLVASSLLDDGLGCINPGLNRFRFGVPIDTKINPGHDTKGGNGFFDIIFCGMMIPSKNLDLIIKMLPKLKKKFPVRLHVISQVIKNDYCYGIINLVKKLGLFKDVIFYGPCEDTRTKNRILSKGSVLIHPTTYRSEGFGRVVVEAFSLGLPVITTDWFGVNELVENRENGFLVKVNSNYQVDKKDLFARILELQGDRDLLNMMRKNNIRKAKEYDFRLVFDKLSKYLHDLAGQNPNPLRLSAKYPFVDKTNDSICRYLFKKYINKRFRPEILL